MTTKNKIDRAEFYHWATQTWVDYASEGVHSARLSKRLRLQANLIGEFRVVFGGNQIYIGTSLEEAIEIYEGAG